MKKIALVLAVMGLGFAGFASAEDVKQDVKQEAKIEKKVKHVKHAKKHLKEKMEKLDSAPAK